uniref:Uncharacterized protein n=1 Tax=Zonotrichia albicollis TaxID=44394 RepID=A0A8D2QHE1_ZONAL
MFYFDVCDREVFLSFRKAAVKNLRANSDSSEPEIMMGIKHISLLLEDAVADYQRRSLTLLHCVKNYNDKQVDTAAAPPSDHS